MKSEKEIRERLDMWLTILENMEKHCDDEDVMYPVRVRIFEYLWILDIQKV
jgi:hypothetical protein